jgi:hypothetical protein
MSSESDPERNAIVSPEEIETAKWTRYLPEAFGIRETVRQSKYRWCVREAAMWGIATGTAMTLHRYRMNSRRQFAANAGFAALMVVYFGSYYFCVKKRDYKEHIIEVMMKLNSFEHALNMPQQMPVDEQHPFVSPAKGKEDVKGTVVPERQYVANLPERKEWQKQLPTQEAAEVFRPANK